MSRVVHFEIPIDDPDRAGGFYGDALGLKVERWGPIDYWTLTSGAEDEPGAEGGLTLREEAPEGVVVYFDVDDIDEAMARVTVSGGELLGDKAPIPGIGWSARIRDTEGNVVGLYQRDPDAPMPQGAE